jgi:hypothetical protein
LLSSFQYFFIYMLWDWPFGTFGILSISEKTNIKIADMEMFALI